MGYIVFLEIEYADDYRDIQSTLTQAKKKLVQDRKKIKGISGNEVYKGQFDGGDVWIQQLGGNSEKNQP